MALYYMEYVSQQETIDKMRDTGIAVDKELDLLESYAEKALVEWEGDDELSYYVAKQKWNEAEIEMNKLLVSMGAKTAEDIMQNVKAAEQANKAQWDY